jgi:hypothetical protein
VADAFYEKLKQRAESIQIGDPLQPGCRMGPVVSAAQYERVRSYVQVSGGRVFVLCIALPRLTSLADARLPTHHRLASTTAPCC